MREDMVGRAWSVAVLGHSIALPAIAPYYSSAFHIFTSLRPRTGALRPNPFPRKNEISNTLLQTKNRQLLRAVRAED